MTPIIPNTIGHFGRLPPEIRAQIWGHFLIELGFRYRCKKPHDSLGILRTRQLLRNEVTLHIYEDVILTFHLSQRAQPDITNWLYITTSVDATWNIAPDKPLFCDHFRTLPYKWLKSIKIKIEAPSQGDPRQVILL